jgi:hypothetical protein
MVIRRFSHALAVAAMAITTMAGATVAQKPAAASADTCVLILCSLSTGVCVSKVISC